MPRRGTPDIKKVWCGGERKKERSFQVRAWTGSREAAGTIRDHIRVNRGSRNREIGHNGDNMHINTPAVSTQSREGY